MVTNERNEELFAGENYSCTFLHLPSITLDYCSGFWASRSPIGCAGETSRGSGDREIHQNSLDSRSLANLIYMPSSSLPWIARGSEGDTMQDRNRR